jgi:hypothetical protein
MLNRVHGMRMALADIATGQPGGGGGAPESALMDRAMDRDILQPVKQLCQLFRIMRHAKYYVDLLCMTAGNSTNTPNREYMAA